MQCGAQKEPPVACTSYWEIGDPVYPSEVTLIIPKATVIFSD